VLIGLSCADLFGKRRPQQIRPQSLGILRRNTQRGGENPCLVPPPGMGRVEAVFPELLNINYCVAAVRKLHESRPLNDQERRHALFLPYQAGEKYTYKNLRNALVKARLLAKDFRLGGLSYPSTQQREEAKAKDPEEQILVKLPAWHELRLHLKKTALEAEWQRMSTAALEGQPEQLDSIGWVLSVYKDDDEVRAQLNKLSLSGVREGATSRERRDKPAPHETARSRARFSRTQASWVASFSLCAVSSAREGKNQEAKNTPLAKTASTRNTLLNPPAVLCSAAIIGTATAATPSDTT
jgi:hypothetical protein